MQAIRLTAFVSALIGAIQLLVGSAMLAWAVPASVDPPFGGQGLIREYSILRKLLAGNESAAEPLRLLRAKLEYLFSQGSDGALFSLISGIVLFTGGAILLMLGLWAIRQLQQQMVLPSQE